MPPTTPPLTVDDVVDEVHYTAAPDLEDVPPQLLAGLLAARELAKRSIADNTRQGTKYHWEAFETYCAEKGVCPLPADPRVVAAHLAECAALVVDEEIVYDDDGRMRPGQLAAVTVAQRLSKINRMHRVNGHPIPGKDPLVVDVIAGIKRTFLMRATKAKAALDMALLQRLLVEVRADTHRVIQDRALTIVAAATEAGAGQLARLGDEHVTYGPEDRDVTIAIPANNGNRYAKPRLVTLRATGRAACPVMALRALQATRDPDAEPGALFRNPAGTAMSRQGLRAALRRLAPSADGTGVELDALALRRVLRDLGGPSLRAVRDEAILLTGWYCALRRANLVALDWGDLAPHGADWSVTIEQSKGDQEGHGEVLWLNTSSNPDWPCPARALSAWRDVVAELIGGDPVRLIPDQAVFMAIDRHGHPDVDGHHVGRLSTDAICELVQRYCAAAELDPDSFGAHSLRAGFVTEALTDGKLTMDEIMAVTLHKTYDILRVYNRRIVSRDSNPVRKLYGAAPTDRSPKPRRVDPAAVAHLPPSLRAAHR